MAEWRQEHLGIYNLTNGIYNLTPGDLFYGQVTLKYTI